MGVGLRYPGRSDLFEGVSSLGNLPNDVGIRFRVFGKGTTPTRDTYRPPSTLKELDGKDLESENALPTMDAPTTSPILMSFWRFGPSLTTSPDKSDPTNAPSGGGSCGAKQQRVSVVTFRPKNT